GEGVWGGGGAGGWGGAGAEEPPRAVTAGLARCWPARFWPARLEPPARRTPRFDGAHGRRRARGEAVHVPRRRPGRGRAVLGGERHARVVGPGPPAPRPPTPRPPRGGGRLPHP